MKHAHSEEKSSLCAFSLSVRNGMVLLLLHRDPDLGVILLVQGALGEFAGVGVHFDAVAGGEMRLPELGDRLLRPLIGEGPGAAQDGKGFLLRFAVGWILSHGRIFFSGNTAQFGKKPQPGFLAQFKLKKWGKKTAAARRHNCAVLPSIFFALFYPNWHWACCKIRP